MPTLIATGPDLDRGPGRPSWREDPKILGRMARIARLLDAGTPWDTICEQEQCSVGTISADKSRLEELARDELASASVDYFLFTMTRYMKGLRQCDRAFEEAPVDSSVRTNAIDKSIKIMTGITSLTRLGLSQGETQAPTKVEEAARQAALDGVTLTETRSLQVGGLEFQRLLNARIEQAAREIPGAHIEDFRAELGGDNIKPVGEVLDVDFDPDAEDGDDEL